MTIDSRAKGQRGEYLVRDMLRKYSSLPWERIPASGALSYLKSDLYVPHEKNKYAVEVKNYEDEAVNLKLLTNKTCHLFGWWDKIKEQAALRDQEPLLFFKHNRSKVFVATRDCPKVVTKFFYLPWIECYICLAEEWLEKETIEWLNPS